MKIEDELQMFKILTEKMNKIFSAKRHDYGASTEETFRKYGPVSMLVRMHDKLNRLDNLLLSSTQNKVVDESVEDTLLDLANYALITLLEMKKIREEECKSNEFNAKGYRMD